MKLPMQQKEAIELEQSLTGRFPILEQLGRLAVSISGGLPDAPYVGVWIDSTHPVPLTSILNHMYEAGFLEDSPPQTRTGRQAMLAYYHYVDFVEENFIEYVFIDRRVMQVFSPLNAGTPQPESTAFSRPARRRTRKRP